MSPASNARPADKVIVPVEAELADLIPCFLGNQRAGLTAMRKALSRNDFTPIRILGHNMKGNGGAYGFDAITEIGGALEHAAKAGNPAEISRQVEALSTYLDRL
jgi:HPt (histidine-containing phosphotransfer) domain-containing protein